MERRSTGRAIEQAYQKAAMLADTWQLERSYEYWSGEEGCVILTGWVRDGDSPNDIAKNIGVSRQTLDKWIKSSETMQDAIRQGSDLVNYRVENALLKSALGYKTKNVTVTTIMRYGKVVEEQKQEEVVDVPPNVAAVKMWLYNKKPRDWMPESKIVDVDTDDSAITVEVINMQDPEEAKQPDNWDDIMNEGVQIRAATEQERMINELQEEQDKHEELVREEIAQDAADATDLDAWPDDWEDTEDDWS